MKSDALRKSRTFVQIIHRWRMNTLSTNQRQKGALSSLMKRRAWTKEQTASFMRQKRGNLISRLNLSIFCLSWRAILAGVQSYAMGGGQEINKGEAGIDEWLVQQQK